jgi:hypothetical protein
MKNNVKQILSDNGKAYSVYVANNDVYVVGQVKNNAIDSIPILWKKWIFKLFQVSKYSNATRWLDIFYIC